MNKPTTLAMVVMSACAFTRPPAVLRAQATTPAQGSYEPHLDSSKFTRAVTHPYFPLVPGTQLRYRGTGASSNKVTVSTVTSQSRTIRGIRATVVHEQAFDRGSLIEDTFDWYAQDSVGNVWYLGEQTQSLKNGRVVSTVGSWESGVNNAKPGLVMWADPAAHIGEPYRQEYLPGVAEDMGKILSVHTSAAVPYGTYRDCVETEDTTPLEPAARERKYYCRGVGMVRELERGGAGSALVAVKRPSRSNAKSKQVMRQGA